jgi:hypothetical protein
VTTPKQPLRPSLRRLKKRNKRVRLLLKKAKRQILRLPRKWKKRSQSKNSSNSNSQRNLLQQRRLTSQFFQTYLIWISE